jgi:hypothetical protein
MAQYRAKKGMNPCDWLKRFQYLKIKYIFSQYLKEWLKNLIFRQTKTCFEKTLKSL